MIETNEKVRQILTDAENQKIAALTSELDTRDVAINEGQAQIIKLNQIISDQVQQIEDLKKTQSSDPVSGEPLPTTPPVIITPPSGIFKNPDTVQNMFEKSPGEWLSKDAWRTDVACLQFKLGLIKPGDEVVTKLARKANYPFKNADGKIPNMKIMRCWPIKVGGYPNWYLGLQVDGAFLFNTEKVEGVKGVVKFYTKYPPFTGDWRPEEWHIKYSSAPGKQDGAIKIVVGGQTILDVRGWQSNTEALPDVANVLCIQDDVSNGTVPEGCFTSYKDIAISINRA